MVAKSKKKDRKTYADTDAGKAEKFRDFANMRTTRALRAVRAISKLSSKRSYVYTETQVKQIVKAVQSELDKLSAAFEGNANKAGEFALSDE
jgi:DNA-binding PadR family transcriptional regulator